MPDEYIAPILYAIALFAAIVVVNVKLPSN